MGGTIPNAAVLPRMFALHIFLVPGMITGLLALHLGMIWRQLHTNYPGPRRTNTTIVGSRLWPSYTAKSLGLLFLVFAAVAGLAAFAQIDPVWIYGPYDPSAVMAGAQPDWYLGWIEGAIRLFPGINLYIGRYLIPELFFSAVLLPSLIFLALYLFPFVEKLYSDDEGDQNVLRMPYDQPFNTALGIAVFVLMLVLLAAGGGDLISVSTGISVVLLRTILRILVFVAPACAAVLTYFICVRMRRSRAARAGLVHDESSATSEAKIEASARPQQPLPSPFVHSADQPAGD